MDCSLLVSEIRSRQRELVRVKVAGTWVSWPSGVVDQIPYAEQELSTGRAPPGTLDSVRDLLICNLVPLNLPRTSCVVCLQTFNSRTSLFQHVRQHGHEPERQARSRFWEHVRPGVLQDFACVAANLGIAGLLLEDGPEDLILDKFSGMKYAPWRVPSSPQEIERESVVWFRALARQHQAVGSDIRSFSCLAARSSLGTQSPPSDQAIAARECGQQLWKLWCPGFNWRLQGLLHFEFASMASEWKAVVGQNRHVLGQNRQLIKEKELLARYLDLLEFLLVVHSDMLRKARDRDPSLVATCLRPCCLARPDAVSEAKRSTAKFLLTAVDKSVIVNVCLLINACYHHRDDDFSLSVAAKRLLRVLHQWTDLVYMPLINITAALGGVFRTTLLLKGSPILDEHLEQLVVKITTRDLQAGLIIAELLVQLILQSALRVGAVKLLCVLFPLLPDGSMAESLVEPLVEVMRNFEVEVEVDVEGFIRQLTGLISCLISSGVPFRKSLTDASCLTPLGRAMYARRRNQATVNVILDLLHQLLGPEQQISQQLEEADGATLVDMLELLTPALTLVEVQELIVRPLQGRGIPFLSRLRYCPPRICDRSLRLSRMLVSNFHVCSPEELAQIAPEYFHLLTNTSVPVQSIVQELMTTIDFLDSCNLDIPPRDYLIEADSFTLLAAALQEARRQRQSPLTALVSLTVHALGPESDPNYMVRRHSFELWGPLDEQLQLNASSVPQLQLSIDPEDVLGSAKYQVLTAFPASLRPGKLKIKFQGQAGIDAGGLRRDFMAKAGAALSDIRLGLLLPAEEGHVQLSPLPGFLACGVHSQTVEGHEAEWCRFLGRLLGTSVTHDIPLGFLLVPSLCKALAGEQPSFQDLEHVLGAQYRSLSACRASQSPVSAQVGSADPHEESVALGAPAALPLSRLTTTEANAALYGQVFEVTSRPTIVFHSLELHLARGNLVDGGLEVATLLLQHAASASQRSAAVHAAESFLCGLVGAVCGVRAEDVPDMISTDGAFSEIVVRKIQSVVSAQALARLLALVRAFPDQLTQSLKTLGDRLFHRVYKDDPQEPASALIVSIETNGEFLRISCLTAGGESIMELTLQPEARIVELARAIKEHTKWSNLNWVSDDIQIDQESPLKHYRQLKVKNIEASGLAALELERNTSPVYALDVSPDEELCRANLETFIAALTDKVLVKNLKPYADLLCAEYRLVTGPEGRKSWQVLQRAIAGEEVDVTSWRNATTYSGYNREDLQVKWWWEVIEELDSAGRRRVFSWCTGYACMPVGGLRFTLQRSGASRGLPTAATCFLTVRLPSYESKELLRSKVHWALEEVGFQNA